MTPVRGTARKALGRSGSARDFTGANYTASASRRHGRMPTAVSDAGRDVEELELDRRLIGRERIVPAAARKGDAFPRNVGVRAIGVEIQVGDAPALVGFGRFDRQVHGRRERT